MLLRRCLNGPKPMNKAERSDLLMGATVGLLQGSSSLLFTENWWRRGTAPARVPLGGSRGGLRLHANPAGESQK